MARRTQLPETQNRDSGVKRIRKQRSGLPEFPFHPDLSKSAIAFLRESLSTSLDAWLLIEEPLSVSYCNGHVIPFALHFPAVTDQHAAFRYAASQFAQCVVERLVFLDDYLT